MVSLQRFLNALSIKMEIMNKLVNSTLKWTLAIIAAAVLFGSCSKDEDPAWLSLDAKTVYVDGFGQTQTLNFAAESIKSMTVSNIPEGWTVTADLATKTIKITAPASLDEEEEGDDEIMRSGTVSIIGRSYEGNSIVVPLFVSVIGKSDISAQRSNCFILSKPYTEYSFDATHKGEGSEMLSAAEVRIIWQTVEDQVQFLSYKEGKVTFYIDGTEGTKLIEGNALLGAYDSAGELLCTWHLWIVEAADVTEQVYANGKTFLSLNLGALGNTNTTNDDILASYGLFYQWGRKDPFVGPYAYNAAKSEDQVIYDADGRKLKLAYVASTVETGTTAYAATHPLSFILGVEASSFDWLYSAHSDALWSNTKTEADPCPKGWRIPSKDDFVGLEIADMAAGTERQFGWSLTDAAMTAFYPAAGFRPYLTGQIQNVYNPISGVDVPKPWVGYYWTNGTTATQSLSMFFWLNAADILKSGIETSMAQHRANGMQVRCVKE